MDGFIHFIKHALGLCGEPHPSLLMGGGAIIGYCVYCIKVMKINGVRKMTKLEILDRIWNILNQGVDTESGDLDLLRHDLENDVIAEQKFNQECG